MPLRLRQPLIAATAAPPAVFYAVSVTSNSNWTPSDNAAMVAALFDEDGVLASATVVGATLTVEMG